MASGSLPSQRQRQAAAAKAAATGADRRDLVILGGGLVGMTLALGWAVGGWWWPVAIASAVARASCAAMIRSEEHTLNSSH